MKGKVLRTVSVPSRVTAPYSLGEDFFLASTEPRGLSARFLINLTMEVAGTKRNQVRGHQSGQEIEAMCRF